MVLRNALSQARTADHFQGKLTDPEKLREYREKGSGIWKFHDNDELVLDITDISPAEAAERINAFVARRQQEGRSYEEW